MASKDSSNNTSRTAPKRLARAKVKHPVTEADTKKGAAKTKGTATKSAQATTTGKSSAKATAEDRKSFWIKVGIGAFAVLMALSMMLPSLASIVSGAQQASSSAQTETTTEADTTDETTTDETATDETAETEESEGETVDTATGVAQIDAAYETQVSSLETKLESDNKNLAALLNLGKLYMQWGAGASYYASTDEENAHVAELFEKAIGYYDRYLEINEDNSRAGLRPGVGEPRHDLRVQLQYRGREGRVPEGHRDRPQRRVRCQQLCQLAPRLAQRGRAREFVRQRRDHHDGHGPDGHPE